MADEKTSPENEDDPQEKESQDSIPERVTFWLSVLVVVALFGFLTYRAFTATRPDSPNAKPGVTVRVNTAKVGKMDDTHWTIPVTVNNSGNVPLEEVSVRITTTDKDGKKQETDLAFAYLAEGASEDAFIVTPNAPEEAKPEAAVMAFKTQRNARGY
ncbi:MAG: hypothetical protein H8F28_27150 [Fibrella sp.]|nr:hypothetical protein [Armatimonadota bacterium]